MGRRPVPASHDLDRCLAGANALAPDLMTADERLTEVAQILAAGLDAPAPARIDERRPWLEKIRPGLLARAKRACDGTAAETGPAMTDTVLAQIAALKTKSTPELRGMWRELFDREPPVLGRRYLEDRLAYRVQELHFGGLSDRARRKLDALVDQLDPKAARRRDPGRPIAGTQLRARMEGRRARGHRREHDFEYNGRPYKSLSAIAREIAGTRWNGWLFFGLRRNGTADEHAAAQGPLRDLLPQEQRRGIWTRRSTLARAARELPELHPEPGVTRAGSPSTTSTMTRLLWRYPGAPGAAAAAPRHRGGKIDAVVCYRIDRLSRSLVILPG